MASGRLKYLLRVGMVLAMELAVFMPAGLVQAGSRLVPGSVAEADAGTVAEIMAAFDQAEEAMRQKDIDKLMAFYAGDYNYHGLTRSDVRKIWKDLFDNYRDVGSTHMFLLIRMSGPSSLPSVEITCTGSLWGTSELTKLQVPIDSWYQEVHFLVKQNGAWRIRGNLGETPKVLPFGTAPHPLF